MLRAVFIILLLGGILSCLKLFLLLPQNSPAWAKTAKPIPYIVVLDPGHGGSDTGAIGQIGKKKIYEKNISLAVALRLKRVLSDKTYWSTLGRPIKVILTRNKDKDISLEERSEIGHRNKADLFLSIHVNSDPSGEASGIETYFLNNTDEKSSNKLVEIENKSSKRKRQAQDLLLKSIAVDGTVENSRAAAYAIHQSLLEHLQEDGEDIKTRGVKQELLYVLLDAQVPAVLSELFFINNPQDVKFLNSADNQQKIAEGLAFGVLRYLAIH